MEVHQRPERDKYHTYWRLHLPMLLNTKKAQKNINAKNTSVVDAYESVDHIVWENG